MTDRMMDGVARRGIEEAIRFLGTGAAYEVDVDGHSFEIIRRAKPGEGFLVVCVTCSRLLSTELENHRRVYPAIYRHVEEPISHG
jgi:hypothetical protein